MNEMFLVINGGSSSLKFSLFGMPEEKEIITGVIERVGEAASTLVLKKDGNKTVEKIISLDINQATERLIEKLIEKEIIVSVDDIRGIGHRIVHGGEKYSDSVLINEDVITDLENLIKFAPLHIPGELDAIKGMINHFPNIPQIAVFDTAFHHTIPDINHRYAVPNEWYLKHNVRKYGFHGTNCKYITEEMQKHYGKEDVNLIICHIGSGASITAVKDGKSYNTSMGMTPLDGIIMGTRSGSIDPSIIDYMVNETGLSASEITKILNSKSGLLGMCGKSDFRDVLSLMDDGDKQATLIYHMYLYAITNYIFMYNGQLNGNIDAIILTAGVSENNRDFRKDIIEKISHTIPITLSNEGNDVRGIFSKISVDRRELLFSNEEYICELKTKELDSLTTEEIYKLIVNYYLEDDEKEVLKLINYIRKRTVEAFLVPANEELMIARDAYNIVKLHKMSSKAK